MPDHSREGQGNLSPGITERNPSHTRERVGRRLQDGMEGEIITQ